MRKRREVQEVLPRWLSPHVLAHASPVPEAGIILAMGRNRNPDDSNIFIPPDSRPVSGPGKEDGVSFALLLAGTHRFAVGSEPGLGQPLLEDR